MPKAPLVFSVPRRLTRDDIDALDPIHRKQLERAAAKSFRAMTFEESLDHVERDDGYWEHLRGTRKDVAVYDIWLVAGDCGRVFEADRVKETGVFMLQSTFEATPKSSHRAALAEITSAYVDALRRKRAKKTR
jgi:hypothetical protein